MLALNGKLHKASLAYNNVSIFVGKAGEMQCAILPNHFKTEYHYTILAFHKLEQKWRHYNPLRSLGARKAKRYVDIARNIVSGVNMS